MTVRTVSASTMAVVVGLSLLASGVLLPVALKLPRWIEFELVLAAWWATFAGLLAVLLFRGTRLREDHAFRLRWNLPDLGTTSSTGSTGSGTTRSGSGSSGSSGWGGSSWSDPGCADGEGCAGVLVGLLLAAVAVAAAWLVVELLFPVVFFLLYWLVVKAIARVANDRHACERVPVDRLRCALGDGLYAPHRRRRLGRPPRARGEGSRVGRCVERRFNK